MKSKKIFNATEFNSIKEIVYNPSEIAESSINKRI